MGFLGGAEGTVELQTPAPLCCTRFGKCGENDFSLREDWTDICHVLNHGFKVKYYLVLDFTLINLTNNVQLYSLIIIYKKIKAQKIISKILRLNTMSSSISPKW